MMKKDHHIGLRVLAGFSVALLLLVFNGVVSLRSIRHYTDLSEQQSQTYDLLNYLSETVSHVTRAETSVRGYMLSGDSDRLRAYREARGALAALLRGLRSSAGADPGQAARVSRLEGLAKERMAAIALAAEIYRSRGSEAARAHVRIGAGNRIMQALLEQAREIESEERRRLLSVAERAAAAGRFAGLMILSGNCLAIFFLSMAGFRIRRDLRERERTEALVSESEERLRAVLDGAQQTSIIATDTQGTITVFNRGAERLLGYSAEEMVGKQSPKVFHMASEIAEHGQALSRRYGRSITGFDVFVEEARQGHYEEREWTYVRKNGDRIIVSLAVTALRDSAGAISGFLGIAVDMTQRKAAERALFDSEERWKFALEGSGDGVWDWDLPAKTVHFSARWKEMLGYAEDELSDSLDEWSRRVHPEDLPAAMAAVEAHCSGKTPVYTSEHRMLCKDGTYKWILDRGRVMVWSPDGKPLRMVGTHTDISERKRAEDELRKLSLAVEQSPACIVITDLKGDIEYVNPKFTELTGYSFAEVLGKNPRVLKSGEFQPEAYKGLWETITAGRVWRGEFHNKKRNGELYWEFASISPVKDSKGEITHFLAVKEDITERKKAAEEIARARDAALDAARTKAAFLSNMSHEIRTPMNAVIGMTELLLDTELTPQQREFAQIIRTAGDSLLGLINDILDFSKIESGRMTLERVEFDLRQEVTGGAALLSVKARTKGIGLETSVAPEVPALVSGDPAKFRQVLVNLISNAVKFTEKGAVSVRVTRESGAEGGLAVLTEVSDTGIGMAPEVLPRLFTAFTQADDSTTRRFGGTGLGLAICRQLVELMGGEIGADSQPGRGSRFWFRLPMGRSAPPAGAPARTAAGAVAPAAVFAAAAPVPAAPVPAAPAAAPPSAVRCVGRILVAEDNDVNQKLIRMQLQKLGHAFDIVGNGRDAVSALEKTPYRMVLMDCQMPVMDGYEATGRIRESEGGQGRLPVIAITAEGFDADRQRCFDAGMDDFLSKPFKVAALKALIERWHSPLDRATLDGLREFIGVGDTASYRDFLEVFLKDVRARLERVRAAAAARDGKLLSEEAHSVKGSAGTVGARYLQGLCRKLEALGKAGAAEQAGPWLEAAAAEFSALAAALENELAGLK